MDFFKKMFGISDRFNDQVTQESSNETIPQKTIPQKTPVPSFLVEKFPWIENAFRIQENDCASCKYIGSGFSYGICIFILTQLRSPPREALKRKTPFYIAIASMSTTFFILGTCRLFDIGFSAPQPGDQKKTFMDFMIDDVEALKRFVNNVAGREIFQPPRKSILVELDKLEKESNEKNN